MQAITNSELAHQRFRAVMAGEVEELWAMALDASQNVLALRCLFRGTVDSCLVHPRDIFRFACLSNASNLIIAHNHPSGDVRPSTHDMKFTQRLMTLSLMMQIPLIDHLILAPRSYVSLAQLGLLRPPVHKIRRSPPAARMTI